MSNLPPWYKFLLSWPRNFLLYGIRWFIAVQRTPPLYPNLSQLDHPSRLLISEFPTNILYVFLIFLTHSACPRYLLLLDLITLVTLNGEHISRSSSYAVTYVTQIQLEV
jgi:hypothetical protein